MNGYANHHLDEDSFGETRSSSLKSFDAFRKLPRIHFDLSQALLRSHSVVTISVAIPQELIGNHQWSMLGITVCSRYFG
jgi:hypothetical protein